MRKTLLCLFLAGLLLLAGCNYAENPVVEPVPTPTPTFVETTLPEETPVPETTPAPTPTPTPTPTPEPTPTPTPPPTPDPWAMHFSEKEQVITVGDDYWCYKGPTLGVVINKVY